MDEILRDLALIFIVIIAETLPAQIELLDLFCECGIIKSGGQYRDAY